jgi:hypothetical protein
MSKELVYTASGSDLYLTSTEFAEHKNFLPVLDASNPRSGRRKEGDQPAGGVSTGRSARIIKEEVLWNAAGAVRCDNGAPDKQPGDDERSHGGEEEGEHRSDGKAKQRLAVGEGAAEEHDELVGGAEDVEEAPGAEDAEEDEEGERVRQERGREGEGDDGGVVDAEVAEVAAQARGGLGEGVGAGESRSVQQLRPWAPVRERAPRRLGQPAHEEAEGRRGERRVGEARGGGRRGAAAGSRAGHGEQRRRCRSGGHGWCWCLSLTACFAESELGLGRPLPRRVRTRAPRCAFLRFYASADWCFYARHHSPSSLIQWVHG